MQLCKIFFLFPLFLSLAVCAETNNRTQYALTKTTQMQKSDFVGKEIRYCLIGQPCKRPFRQGVVAEKDESGFTTTTGEKFLYSDIYAIFYDVPAHIQRQDDKLRSLPIPMVSNAERQQQRTDDALKPSIVIQVCIPIRVVSRDPISVTQVRKGSLLSGGGHKPKGITDKKQFVYELFSDIQSNVRSYIVSVPSTAGYADYMKYVFIPPGEIPSSSWTDWSLPNFQSTHPELATKLLFGQSNWPRLALDEHAPRIRYTLISHVDYRVRSDNMLGSSKLKEIKPPC